jgi:tetratricopeptide (TPR) repeat protein
LRQTGFLAPLSTLLCRFALVLMESGRLNGALTSIDDALQHSANTGGDWYYAELCRVKGEILRAMGQAADAQHWIVTALVLSSRVHLRKNLNSPVSSSRSLCS